jgi:orotidine-5'-phosphate decarboxylase
MDMETGIMLGAGLVSIGAKTAYNCFGKSKKKKWSKIRFGAIVMSCMTGKSTLCKQLRAESGVYLIDVSQSVAVDGDTNADVNYLMKAKEYVDKIKNEMKEFKLILVCSSIQEAQYLGVDVNNIAVVTPSNKLFNTICEGRNPENVEEMSRKRMELISACGEDVLNIFDSYESLYALIKSVFKLKQKF